MDKKIKWKRIYNGYYETVLMVPIERKEETIDIPVKFEIRYIPEWAHSGEPWSIVANSVPNDRIDFSIELMHLSDSQTATYREAKEAVEDAAKRGFRRESFGWCTR